MFRAWFWAAGLFSLGGEFRAGVLALFGEASLVLPCPFTPRYLERFVPFLEPLREMVRADSFSTAAIQMSFDQSESIASRILSGSSFAEDDERGP